MLQFAYLDPGSGSILLQAVVGGMLGAGLVMRRKLAGVVKWARNILRRKDSED